MESDTDTGGETYEMPGNTRLTLVNTLNPNNTLLQLVNTPNSRLSLVNILAGMVLPGASRSLAQQVRSVVGYSESDLSR